MCLIEGADSTENVYAIVNNRALIHAINRK